MSKRERGCEESQERGGELLGRCAQALKAPTMSSVPRFCTQLLVPYTARVRRGLSQRMH